MRLLHHTAYTAYQHGLRGDKAGREGPADPATGQMVQPPVPDAASCQQQLRGMLAALRMLRASESQVPSN
jgi:hypothetical protein